VARRGTVEERTPSDMVSPKVAYFFENDKEKSMTVNSERYVTISENYV